MPDAALPVKGTQPEGAESEADASRKVREMFTQIAPRYDFLNHLLSLQLDRLWRSRLTRRVYPLIVHPDALVLDVCCGTGDLALSLASTGNARVLGADFAHTMLLRAKQKTSSLGRHDSSGKHKPTVFFEADALRLPFASESFDLVTTAFGFRNLSNYEAGLREFLRVLKPGGALAILEFTEPPNGLFGTLYRWYFRNVLPRIGALISRDSSAYSYLPRSVSRFFLPPELASLMRASGFGSVDFHTWTFGTVALHLGVRPL